MLCFRTSRACIVLDCLGRYLVLMCGDSKDVLQCLSMFSAKRDTAVGGTAAKLQTHQSDHIHNKPYIILLRPQY